MTDIKNTLTPEEAATPVTYGELLTILMPVIEDIAKGTIKYCDDSQDKTHELILRLADNLVKIRNDADYKRQRDLRFMIGLFAQFNHCDKEIIYKEYVRWCEEFDKLNKPQEDSKKEDGENA